MSPLKNADQDHIGSRTGNSFERKFSLLMHVDACKAQEIVEKKIAADFSCWVCHIVTALTNMDWAGTAAAESHLVTGWQDTIKE